MTLRGGRPGWGGAFTALFGFARNRRQPSADHLLFPAGGRLVLAQRRHRRLAGETLGTLRQTHGGARRPQGMLAARFELRAAVVHRPAREGYHARRFGAGRDRRMPRAAGWRSAYATAWSYGRAESLEPADPRLHGQRLGPAPSRRTAPSPRRAERPTGMAQAPRSSFPPTGASSPTPAGPTYLGAAALFLGAAGGRCCARRPRPLVDRGGEPRHAAAGVGRITSWD